MVLPLALRQPRVQLPTGALHPPQQAGALIILVGDEHPAVEALPAWARLRSTNQLAETTEGLREWLVFAHMNLHAHRTCVFYG
jgi:hypothetical protein